MRSSDLLSWRSSFQGSRVRGKVGRLSWTRRVFGKHDRITRLWVCTNSPGYGEKPLGCAYSPGDCEKPWAGAADDRWSPLRGAYSHLCGGKQAGCTAGPMWSSAPTGWCVLLLPTAYCLMPKNPTAESCRSRRGCGVWKPPEGRRKPGWFYRARRCRRIWI